MEYEVEQKFRVNDFTLVEKSLASMGIELDPVIEQVDCYFAHPARDFCVTDEAFRLRRTGEKNHLTYKGPRIDTTTKTRRELELPLPEGELFRRQLTTLLDQLGFRAVDEVHKERRKAHLSHEGFAVEVSFDRVKDVGLYIELEILAAESDLPQAKRALANLAGQLGLTENERRSYLDLLQDRKNALAKMEPNNR